MALQPRGAAEPEASVASVPAEPPHWQHFLASGAGAAFSSWQEQQSTGGGCGWQWGAFSQTRAHLGFSQSLGRWHFQSQRGSSQTDSHLGVGLVHSVWHIGSLQTVSHLGQAPFSQCLTGQRTSHSGLSHLMAHLEQVSSWQRVEHRGCSQMGSQTWLQTGLEHFHWHLGWQSPFSPQSPLGSSHAEWAAVATRARVIKKIAERMFVCGVL
mmetsp:Transcript_65403/g.158273  ORF Transcript_65403/g.158273 Transcript_65403/m.158273 type:complete len:211 (-) Transcript_65403:19-651(-)